jgi:hypothetical protein
MLRVTIHSIVFVGIFSLLRNLISFLKKSTMTLWPNVIHNGAAISLPVSRAERIFARAIHNELTGVLGADATTCSTVTLYIA